MKVNANLRHDDDSFELGEIAEDLFVKAAEGRGYEARKSSAKEDIWSHIDYYITNKQGDVKSFDVKSRKRTSRRDNDFNDEWVWVEFKNVRGYRGWLKGKADFISFETQDTFLSVRRKELLELCEKLVNLQDKVSDSRLAKYKAYTRHGRKDVLSLIKMKDIREHLQTWEWRK
tara:strand:- start:57 stop:575 length:519 start_codon:yes stop_codon:yes gene_type:complete